MAKNYLHLEGDSKIIVDAIVKGSSNSWFLQTKVQLIKETLSTFVDFKVSHTYREGNDDVDKLANWATSFNCINKIEVEDLRGMENVLEMVDYGR